jgi:phosphoribosylamine--glycine ligase
VDSQAAATIMAVSQGYPQAYEKGKEISGLETVSEKMIFHAGTTLKEGKVFTSGGRVMAVTSFGQSHKEAIAKSYETLNKVCFEGINYRKDIGFDL